VPSPRTCLLAPLWLSIVLLAAPSVQDLLQQAERKIEAEQFSLAEPLLAEALRLEPANTEVLYRLGYVHYRQRKLVEASDAFSTVVKTAPPAYHSRYFLGRIALLNSKPAEAISWLEPIVESKQSVFDTHAQLAAAYAAAGRRQQAVSALRAAIANTPWDGGLYYRLGQLYSQVGQKELAQEALESSRRLKNASREDVEALMQTARLLNELRKTEAVRAAAEVLHRKDADPNALVALGVIFGNADMPAEALEAFGGAAERDPRSFQAQYNRGLALLKLNRAPEALAPLAQAVELLPQSLDASMTFGLASVMNQRYSDAIEPLERVWQSDQSNVRVGALLATAYLRTGAAAQAVPILKSTALRSSKDPAPALLLVEALNAVEDQNGALEVALEAQSGFPKFPQAHLAAAQQLARVGKYQEARPAFEKTLQLSPGLPEAELGFADSLQKSGDHEAALDRYRAAMHVDRTAPAAVAGLARSLLALRRLEEARKLLEDAVAKYPSQVPLRVELSRVYARLGKSDLASEQTKAVERLRSEQASR
jgi:tetratricopeptide (TPR) repeat protein